MRRKPLLAALLIALVATALAPVAADAARRGPVIYRFGSNTAMPNTEDSVNGGCPRGLPVTGGGGSLSGPAAPVAGITTLHPTDVSGPGEPSRDGYMASGYNGTEIPRKVRAVAICLRRNRAQLVDVEVSGDIAADQPAGGLDAQCPAGTRLLGGGGLLEGPMSGVSGLTQSGPFDADPLPTGWLMEARRPIDGGQRHISVAATCLPAGLRPIRYRERAATVGPGQVKSLKVRCAHPKFRASGGGVVGNVQIFASIPFDGRDRDRAPDDGWRIRVRNNTIQPQPIELDVICLR